MKTPTDELLELRGQLEVAEQERNEECAIVSRIWTILRNPSYESLKGRSIYDIVETLQAEHQQALARAQQAEAVRDALREALEEMVLHCPKCKGLGYWIPGAIGQPRQIQCADPACLKARAALHVATASSQPGAEKGAE